MVREFFAGEGSPKLRIGCSHHISLSEGLDGILNHSANAFANSRTEKPRSDLTLRRITNQIEMKDTTQGSKRASGSADRTWS